MNIEQFFVVNSNFLYFAFGYFLADILHYIFVVSCVLKLQKKLAAASTNKRQKKDDIL